MVPTNNLRIAQLLLTLCLFCRVGAVIVITYKEEQCMEKTGKFFETAGKELQEMRHEFAASLSMGMTSKDTMSASYPAEMLKDYDSLCSKYGGKLHSIKIDFFDCYLLSGTPEDDVELTLKYFANCMADVEECEGFNQEHIIQEAWKEMGLKCELEAEETKKDSDKNKKKPVDNDPTAKKEKEAAAKGANEAEREEEKNEYVPKEEGDKNGNRKKKGGFLGSFFKFLLAMGVCWACYVVFDRKRRGYPIEIPFFGGSAPSRFQRRPQTGFVSDYNLLSGEESELQFSSNLA
ncbi:unnamed protein product [Pseudo-nitzschia multistriata]|uniref:Uncharacterized protein n=1 Tax=Pseudo-nitzschia multistriata TaxID=183589 RepID=A0A448ZC43_9STRA|nr:unnamed protein product [Pseudo-nitzschia multistriata]